MSTPDTDMTTHLNTNVAALTYNTNLFRGPVVAESAYVPDLAVFCLSTGGPKPEAYIFGGTGVEEREHGLLIRVRSAPGEFEAGQTLARAVRDAAHRAVIAGYHDIYVRECDPAYYRLDDKGHHFWSIGVAMESEE